MILHQALLKIIPSVVLSYFRKLIFQRNLKVFTRWLNTNTSTIFLNDLNLITHWFRHNSNFLFFTESLIHEVGIIVKID